ncbi:MAG: tetratricopeptide repeat protein [Saprospiraceae bacterium]|nr:tetratricopeptide repeat protein [Saprospiraceae bacterium]
MNQINKAEILLLEAKDIFENKLKDVDNQYYFIGIHCLANISYQQEKYDLASTLFDQELKEVEQTFGVNHPEVLPTLYMQACLNEKLGSYELASSKFLRATALDKDLLIKGTHHLSEQELNQYLVKFEKGQVAVLGFANHLNKMNFKDQSSFEICYDNSLFYKGFILNAMNKIKRHSEINPSIKEKFINFKSQSALLSAEYSKPIVEQQNISSLEEGITKLEKSWHEKHLGFRKPINKFNGMKYDKSLVRMK